MPANPPTFRERNQESWKVTGPTFRLARLRSSEPIHFHDFRESLKQGHSPNLRPFGDRINHVDHKNRSKQRVDVPQRWSRRLDHDLGCAGSTLVRSGARSPPSERPDPKPSQMNKPWMVCEAVSIGSTPLSSFQCAKMFPTPSNPFLGDQVRG